MQIKIITIPSIGGEEQTELLNKFLRGNKIITIDKNFYLDSSSGYWSFCISFIPLLSHNSFQDKKDKVDYKNVLSDVEFPKFTKLRILRKQIAEGDAVPAYAVFTDAELAEMSKMEEITSDSLLKVEGLGNKRVEKYGEQICRLYNTPE